MSNVFKSMYDNYYNHRTGKQLRGFLHQLVKHRNSKLFVESYSLYLSTEILILQIENGLTELVPKINMSIQTNGSYASLEEIFNFCSENNKPIEPTIKQVAEVRALMQVHTFLQAVHPLLEITKNPNHQEELKKAISFKSEIVKPLFTELKEYFIKEEQEKLLSILEGKKEEKIIFLYNANRLLELFRRLKYNDYILDNKNYIKHWIQSQFLFKNEATNKVSEFKLSTIHAVLYGLETAQPSKRKRIINVEWLPFKTSSQIKNTQNRSIL